jgi:hypothetical protein
MTQYDRLLSSGRRREISELCRLEKLAAAARLGTAWLQGDPRDRVTQGGAKSVRSSGSCSWPPEDCHACT